MLHALRHDAEDVAPSNSLRGPTILPRIWRFSELATKTLTGFTIYCVPRIVGWKITTWSQWL